MKNVKWVLRGISKIKHKTFLDSEGKTYKEKQVFFHFFKTTLYTYYNANGDVKKVMTYMNKGGLESVEYYIYSSK